MLYVIGIIFMVSGIGLIYNIRRRQFDRRNAFGREVFGSYWSATINCLMEALVYCLAVLLIITALLIAIVAYDGQAGKAPKIRHRSYFIL